MYKVDKALKDYNTNANFRRWNYRMNVDIDITKSTLLKVGVSGSLQKANDSGVGVMLFGQLLWDIMPLWFLNYILMDTYQPMEMTMEIALIHGFKLQ